LLDRGFSLEESAAIRGLDLSAIVRHATLMACKGQRIPIERLLPSQTLALWEEHVRGGEVAPPSGSDLSVSGFWALFLACRSSKT